MKTVILIDNIGDDVLTGEWGLSFYIEYKDRKILLDAGGISGAFAGNAEKLGISLEEVDTAVLSHAHYDHADGMSTFFRLNDHAKLYLRESCGENCYKKPDGKIKYIGIRQGFLEAYAGRLVRVSGAYQLGDGIWLLPFAAAGTLILIITALRDKGALVKKLGRCALLAVPYGLLAAAILIYSAVNYAYYGLFAVRQLCRSGGCHEPGEGRGMEASVQRAH